MDNTLPPLKRIAAIHDLSGLGKCSLTVALPVISATGVECACIPTAVLSTHTGEFTGWTFRDLSDDMLSIAHHWQRIGVRIDGVYSGYLASPEQAQLLAQTLDCIAAPDTLVVIDPVMADNGSYYSKIDDRMCAAFRRLLSRATSSRRTLRRQRCWLVCRTSLARTATPISRSCFRRSARSAPAS